METYIRKNYAAELVQNDEREQASYWIENAAASKNSNDGNIERKNGPLWISPVLENSSAFSSSKFESSTDVKHAKELTRVNGLLSDLG